MRQRKYMIMPKETKGKSSIQTPFTLLPKHLAIKKQFLTPQKYFPHLKKKSLLYEATFYNVKK